MPTASLSARSSRCDRTGRLRQSVRTDFARALARRRAAIGLARRFPTASSSDATDQPILRGDVAHLKHLPDCLLILVPQRSATLAQHARLRALARRFRRRPRVARAGTLAGRQRRRAARVIAADFGSERPAARRGRRRSDARALAQAPAGHADGHPPEPAACRMRLRARSRTPSGICARGCGSARCIRTMRSPKR